MKVMIMKSNFVGSMQPRNPIQEIYDNDSGEIIWRLPADESYSEEDEVIMNSLLMWGELESTIM